MKAKKKTTRTRTTDVSNKKDIGESMVTYTYTKKKQGKEAKSVSYTDVGDGFTAKRNKRKTKIISTKKAERQKRRKNPRYGVENRPKDSLPTIPSIKYNKS